MKTQIVSSIKFFTLQRLAANEILEEVSSLRGEKIKMTFKKVFLAKKTFLFSKLYRRTCSLHQPTPQWSPLVRVGPSTSFFVSSL